MSWQSHLLGDVCVRITDGTHHSPPIVSEGIPYVTAKHIKSDGIRFFENPWYISPEDHAAIYSRCDPKKGDVLYIKDGATTGIAAVNEYDFPFSMLSSVALLRPHADQCEPRYLCHWLNSPLAKEYFIGQMGGAAIKRLTLAKIKRFEMPLPPLSEQKRIAEILDRAESLRRQRSAALALLDELTQSIFLDMFGDAEVQGSKWPVRRVVEYVDEFQGGKSLESTDDNDSRCRVLKVSAVTGMKFRPCESKPIDDDYQPPDEHYVRNGDLLFSRANTTELVGAVAYVTNCPQNLLLPDKLWRFVWKNDKTVHPLFIWYLFQTRSVRREIGNRATGTSGSMKNISKAKLFGIPTILPPFDLQQAFADRIKAIEQMHDRLKESLGELDQLFAALQYRAFRGEL